MTTDDDRRAPRILLVVGGGIAAYKSATLVRRLRASGCEVRCVLTRAAEQFVTPLSLEVLSGRAVHRQEYLSPTGTGEELHIEVVDWADVFVVAPATAHLIGRLALGLADDFATTAYLAWEGPVVVAPAMHHRMWWQESVQQNVATLRQRGVRFVGPDRGLLASGEEDIGRLSEPEDVAEVVLESVERSRSLFGRTVLVSAGPTREPVDPVRYLGNRSSGRMGFAMASEAARRGARTILVAGPVSLPTPAGVERVDVRTALEMKAAVDRAAVDCDVVVMTAAVADFRPGDPAEKKSKKEDGPPKVDLVANPDILRELADVAPDAFRVGFAAETEWSEEEAWAKLARKRCHLLVWNDVSGPRGAFGAADNEVVLFEEGNEPRFLERQSKARVAAEIWDRVEEKLNVRSAHVASV